MSSHEERASLALDDRAEPAASDSPAPVTAATRPSYEPPRLTLRRPVRRATLFTGGGPDGGGLVG